MRKHLLAHTFYAIILSLLVMSGPGCIAYSEGSTGDLLSVEASDLRSYITPAYPSIRAVLREIVGEPPYQPSRAGFDDIRDWVATNIAYVADEERWGKDQWQTAEETLSYRTGDCEDFSILLCSLLRAYGIDAERIYVALGADGGKDSHAFVIENWYQDGQWRRIEAQAPAHLPTWRLLILFRRPHPDEALDRYEIRTMFNDVYCHEEPFSWSEEQADTSLLVRIIDASASVLRELWQVLQYVLRLVFD